MKIFPNCGGCSLSRWSTLLSTGPENRCDESFSLRKNFVFLKFYQNSSEKFSEFWHFFQAGSGKLLSTFRDYFFDGRTKFWKQKPFSSFYWTLGLKFLVFHLEIFGTVVEKVPTTCPQNFFERSFFSNSLNVFKLRAKKFRRLSNKFNRVVIIAFYLSRDTFWLNLFS